MAVTKSIQTASLSIEVQSGTDKAGLPTYTKSATCCYLKRIA